MAICGAVLRLASEEAANGELAEFLVGLDVVEVGSRQGANLPVVLDTPDRQSFTTHWNMLRARPEVLDVHLAFVHYDEGDRRDAEEEGVMLGKMQSAGLAARRGEAR